ELDGAADRQGLGAVDELLQVLPGDVLEDDELAAVLLAAVDHGDDVRVRELRDGAGLTAEALDVLLVVVVVLVEDLQRDVAIEQLVVRLVDAGHPAGTDQLLELVAFSDSLTDHGALVPGRSRRHAGSTALPGFGLPE